jgi:hypothetical protein
MQQRPSLLQTVGTHALGITAGAIAGGLGAAAAHAR